MLICSHPETSKITEGVALCLKCKNIIRFEEKPIYRVPGHFGLLYQAHRPPPEEIPVSKIKKEVCK